MDVEDNQIKYIMGKRKGMSVCGMISKKEFETPNYPEKIVTPKTPGILVKKEFDFEGFIKKLKKVMYDVPCYCGDKPYKCSKCISDDKIDKLVDKFK